MTAGDRSFLKSMCEGMNDEVDNAPLPLGPDQNKDDVRFIGNALFWGLTKGAKNVDGARAFCAKMREFTKELKDEAAKTPGDEEAGLSAEQEEVCDYADSHSRLVYENGFGTWETERWEMWIEATLNNTPGGHRAADLQAYFRAQHQGHPGGHASGDRAVYPAARRGL